jgi:hypothetical protein
MMQKETKNITLLSGVHGRDRRRERNIGKKDLQAAVKYGVKERGHSDRWFFLSFNNRKYTFANVVYITDETSREEITSYILPLSIDLIPLNKEQIVEHNSLANALKARPTACTSHTVLVIDQSGSMRNSDVADFRSRSDAVFAQIALDLIGSRIDSRQTNGTDVVTLIEMRDTRFLDFSQSQI